MATEDSKRDEYRITQGLVRAPQNKPFDVINKLVNPPRKSPNAVEFSEQASQRSAPQNHVDPRVLKALRREGNFQPLQFTATLSVALLRPQEARTYLIIQNTAASGNLILGFGFQPVAANNFGITLTPGSSYEPWTIPTDEIYVVGSAASVTGFLLFANEKDRQ